MDKLLRRGRIFFATLAAFTGFVLLGTLFISLTHAHDAWVLIGLATAAVSFLFGMLVFLTLVPALLREGKSLEEVQEAVVRMISINDRMCSSMQSGVAFLSFVQVCLMMLVIINRVVESQIGGDVHFVLLVAITMTGILGAFAVCSKWTLSFCGQKKVDAAETSAEQDTETVPESTETMSSSTALVPVVGGPPALSK